MFKVAFLFSFFLNPRTTSELILSSLAMGRVVSLNPRAKGKRHYLLRCVGGGGRETNASYSAGIR